MASYVQTSFSGGIWSQAMQGNSARPDYRTAMNECLNGVPIDTGAWCRRSGTQTGGFTRGGAAAKLLRFDFQETAPYNLEFTDGYLRLWNGASPAFSNDPQSIASISTANPAVVQTALANAWSTGNAVRFSGLGKVCPLLQAREFTITVIDSTHFSIADAITGAAIDGSTLGWVAGTTATVQRVYEITTPYAGGTWSNLRSVQTEKQSVLLNGSQPQILKQVTPPGAGLSPTFTFTPSNFLDGPYLDPFPGSICTPSAVSGNITLTFSFQTYSATQAYSLGDYCTSSGISYKSLANGNLNNTPASSPTFWTVVNGADPISAAGLVTSDIGRHIRLYSEPSAWASGTAYTTGNLVSYLNTYWIAAASSTGVVPGTDPTKWSVSANASLWTWGRIIAVSGSGAISGGTGTPIGSMTYGGGLAAAFNGSLSQPTTSAATGLTSAGVTQYLGKNFGGQQIQQVVIYPATGTTDKKLGLDFTLSLTAAAPPATITINLRAKNTAPASSSDGTLLGTTGPISNTTTGVPITILSNDLTTSWNYVWVEITPSIVASIAQLVFFSPNAATGSVCTVQIAGPPLLYINTINTWRLGAFSDTTGWPKCGTYHEGRLWLSGSISNRVDASNSNDIFNFAPTKTDGTVTASNAIAAVFNAPDVNAIFWMQPDQQGIICGTQAGEWLIQASALNNPLSPTNIQAHRVTTIKCANVEAIRTDHTTIFVQKNTKRMMEYFADVYSGKFAAPNLSLTAKHLTAAGIAEIRYQQDLMPVVWVRNTDGTLVGLSYHRESLMSRDGPTLAAWHRHTLGSGFKCTSIVVGPSTDGQRDALAMVTQDGSGRYRYEVLMDLFEETAAPSAAWLLDSAVTPTNTVIGPTSITLNGLYHLNGYTATVVAGGLDCGDFTVANGSVTVPFGDGITSGAGFGQFTAAFAATAPITVGFAYTSRGQCLRPASQAESGTRDGPAFGKVRRAQDFAVQLVNSFGVSFGTVFGKLRPAIFKQPNGTAYNSLTPFSGIFQEKLEDNYSFDSMLAWEVTRPFPVMVTAIGAFLQTQDR